MASARDIMEVAIKELGTVEHPVNRVKYNKEYYGTDVSGVNYAWCCSFVWWVFKQANASELFYNGEKTAYCPNVDNWGLANNLCVEKSQGKYGDIVLFDWDGGNADHIGFIEKRNDDGTYTTIEGNTSLNNNTNGGQVMRRTRSISLIKRIIRPKYSMGIQYRVHQQTYGWSEWVNEGEACGVTGQSKRIEAIQINPNGRRIGVSAHIEGVGWVEYGLITKDTIIGTVGQSRRIEAICLEGAVIMLHIQSLGWSDGFTKEQGTIGLSKRIESIKIK